MFKKIIAAIVMLAAASAALAFPNDIWFKRSNNTDTGTQESTIYTEVDGIMWFNITSQRAEYLRFGTGLSKQLVGDYYYLNASAGSWSSLTGKPSFATVATTGDYADLASKPTLAAVASSGLYSDLVGAPSSMPVSAHQHPVSDINDSSSIGRDLMATMSQVDARGIIGAGTSNFSGYYFDMVGIPSTFTPKAHNQAWSTITATPTTLAGYGITDSVSASALTPYALSSAVNAALGGKFPNPVGSTSQYLRGDGSLATFPTPLKGDTGDVGATGPTGATGPQGPAGTPAATFNFSDPATRTIAVSTAYQATNTAKAAIVSASVSCQNATTVLASSACTLQVRQSPTSGLTCSTGTVAKTWTSTVQLGLVFTQTSGSPLEVHVPIGGYFILCPTSGTFTIAASEQSAG